MAYADKTYYRSTYQGRACTDDDTLEKWLDRASDDIDIFMSYSIVEADLYAIQLELIKKATCAQAEYYVINGDGEDDFESFSIGSFSLNSGTIAKNKGEISGKCLKYLVPAGFGNRSVPCVRSQR